MPYAITLRLDAGSAASVTAMWENLAARGVSDDAIRLGYPPHLTLAVFPDETDRTRLLGTAREQAVEWNAVPITLASLGLFPGSPGALFLAPVVTPGLIGLHARLLSSLSGETVDSHYREGHWVPHVTLAGEPVDPAAAFAALSPLRLPITGVLDTVEVVHFRPVRVLASHRLKDVPAGHRV